MIKRPEVRFANLHPPSPFDILSAANWVQEFKAIILFPSSLPFVEAVDPEYMVLLFSGSLHYESFHTR